MNINNFLFKLINDDYYLKKINDQINDIIKYIENGYDISSIKKRVKYKNMEILYDIARSRIRIKNKFSAYDKIFMDNYSARYSTPEIVGIYRSLRLKGNSIIDIGSGAGMQSIFFGMNSHVVGIEKDKMRYIFSILNKRLYDSDVEFINSDFFNYRVETDDAIIFSDPLRPERAKERKMEDLIPSPENILAHLESIKGYAFDIPPQMQWKNIKLLGEKEYISINGRINRLTIYSESISRNITKAVMLPENKFITGTSKKFYAPIEKYHNERYIYWADISLIYSGLVNMVIVPSFRHVYNDGKRIIFSSDTFIPDFFGRKFRVLEISEMGNLIDMLRKANAGHIYLAYSIETSEYYRMKNYIEQKLSGNLNIYIFKNMDALILTREC